MKVQAFIVELKSRIFALLFQVDVYNNAPIPAFCSSDEEEEDPGRYVLPSYCPIKCSFLFSTL